MDKISNVLGILNTVAGRMAIELGKSNNRIYPNLSVALLSQYYKKRDKLNNLLTNIKKKYKAKIKIDRFNKPKFKNSVLSPGIKTEAKINKEEKERAFLKKYNKGVEEIMRIKKIGNSNINELKTRVKKLNG